MMTVFSLAALAACGGDAEPTGSSTTPPTTLGTTPAGSLFSSRECDAAVLAMTAATSGGFSNLPVSPNEAILMLQRLATSAPDVVRTDIELVATELQKFIGTLASAGIVFDMPSTFANQQAVQALQAAVSAYRESGAVAAGDRFRPFFNTLCPG